MVAELGHSLTIHPSVAEFPHPALVSSSVVGSLGAVFFFGALAFNFVILLGQMVKEKEVGLRESLELMGINTVFFEKKKMNLNFSN